MSYKTFIFFDHPGLSKFKPKKCLPPLANSPAACCVQNSGRNQGNLEWKDRKVIPTDVNPQTKKTHFDLTECPFSASTNTLFGIFSQAVPSSLDPGPPTPGMCYRPLETLLTILILCCHSQQRVSLVRGEPSTYVFKHPPFRPVGSPGGDP